MANKLFLTIGLVVIGVLAAVALFVPFEHATGAVAWLDEVLLAAAVAAGLVLLDMAFWPLITSKR